MNIEPIKLLKAEAEKWPGFVKGLRTDDPVDIAFHALDALLEQGTDCERRTSE